MGYKVTRTDLKKINSENHIDSDPVPMSMLLVSMEGEIKFCSKQCTHLLSNSTKINNATAPGALKPFLEKIKKKTCQGKPDVMPGLITKNSNLFGDHYSIKTHELVNIQNEKLLAVMFDDRSILEERELKFQGLISTASHEIRGPLTNIIGFIELLEQDKYGCAQDKQIIEILKKQANLLNDLVGRLLDNELVEKVSSGSSYFENTTIEEVIEECCLAVNLRESSHEIIEKFDIPWPIIRCDLLQVRQAFTNILNNSCKYADQNTKIVVSTLTRNEPGCNESWFGVNISDTGPGIANEELNKLEEVFYRSPCNKETAGTGLGLAITREIMNIHKGKLEIISEKGHGTSVTLWFRCFNIKHFRM